MPRSAMLFKASSIAALSLAFSLAVSAQDIPKDAAGFTDYVAAQLRAELTDTPIVVKGPLTLGIDKLQANLDRIHCAPMIYSPSGVGPRAATRHWPLCGW
jgi:hypothetical protein